jgi:hypothetical protein
VGGRTRISLLACLFAFGLAGCGSNDGTIPQDQSGDLLALLDNVKSQAESGDCDTASAYANEFAKRVDGLPSEVDPDVREELDKAAANLDQLASEPDQCQPVETGASGPDGVETPTESTETVEPTTTSTEEETTTTTTTTDEEEPTAPPSDDGGNPGQSDEGLTPPSGDEGQQGGSTGEGSGGGVTPPSGGVGAGGGAGAK